MNAIKIVSEKMGISTDEFYEMNKTHILEKEEAGLGFALSIIKSKEYSGKEIGSIQVLNDFNVNIINNENIELDSDLIEIIKKVIHKFNEQYNGWIKMNIFEKQWVLRDFKKNVELSADECFKELNYSIENITNTKMIQLDHINLYKKLKKYFERQYKLLQGYEKDKMKLKSHSEYLLDLIALIEKVIENEPCKTST